MEGNADKWYKLMVKSLTNHSAETIKNIIKASINPTCMKRHMRLQVPMGQQSPFRNQKQRRIRVASYKHQGQVQPNVGS